MTSRAKKRGAVASEELPARAVAYRLEEQIGFRLRKAHQRATEVFHAVMAEFDVTPMQFAVIAKLDDLGAVSQNQLGRHIAMDPATTFGVVGRLIKRRLVVQRFAPEDARLLMIELTPEGADLVSQMKRRGAQVSSQTLAPLNVGEQQNLLDLLARIG